MIDSLSFPRTDFDLRGFVQDYEAFFHDWSGHDSLAMFIVGIEKFGDSPGPLFEYDSNAETDDILDLLESGQAKVFFMMHEPAADHRFLCIDGKKRNSADLDIGVSDGYGFLVEVEGDVISLHPALYDGTSAQFPRLDLQGTCSILEEPMKQFVQNFVLG